MDVGEYLRLLRRRWRLAAAFTVLGLAGGAALTSTAIPIYQADTQAFVSLQEPGGRTSAYQNSLFSQQRVKSYARIVSTPTVTEPVVRQLRLRLSPAQLAARISASVPPDTVLIDIRVRDESPTQAQQIAAAVGTRFAEAVGRLETATGASRSLVKVTIVEPATLPATPVSPRPRLNLALGFAVGLALGIGLAVLREVLDTSVTTTEDLQQLTGSSPLGAIGFDPQAERAPIVSALDSRSIRLEAFRTLRTNLRFVDVDSPPRVVVVTSAVAGEGKSTTACNLAVTLASAGSRVILVEADLRRPRIAEYMGLEGAVGLTDVLIGRTRLDDVLQPWGPSLLAVLPSGPLPPNPSEMLSSAQMHDLLAALRSRAELVLIDAPPLLPVTDAAVLARECDGALLVVRHGRTSREQVTRAVEALRSAGARVLGTVLNMVPTGGGSGYGYYHTEYAARADRPSLFTMEEGPVDRRSRRSRVG